MIGCLSYALEQLGLYEPEINAQEANDRLRFESKLWKNSQSDRSMFWSSFQGNNISCSEPPPLVKKAISHLESQHIEKGVAVDLGCGINATTLELLKRGWKVYAVDSSEDVIKRLEKKFSSMKESWIENGQLVLVKQSIEKFKFPEKVHLVIATESLPYCNPKSINKIFLEIKKALLPQGILACNLFPYNDNAIANNLMRGMFGGWMTTKNVVEAVVKSIDFSTWSVTEGTSPSGKAKQFHVFAQA